MLLDVLHKRLSSIDRFTDESGHLLRAAVTDAAMNMDPALLQVIMDEPELKAQFFTKVGDVLVFDKTKFSWVVDSKEFLPDSYTAYKNKIGLIDDRGNLISQSSNVSLAWPYKDCILEGGQTKEDAKHNEVFYSETLARHQASRLLSRKVIRNAVRHNADGNSQTTTFSEDDNLIIRGNNLVTLHSLRPRFEGKVKLIYIDPPYNTGDDSFSYNDRFNHSSWLTFMKNRLDAAKKLLAEDGSIFVHIDHHELGYLQVLMDEVFGTENRVQIISIKTSSPAGFKTINPGPIDVTEYLLFYTKNKRAFPFKKGYVPVGYHSNYNLVLKKTDDLANWKFIPIKQAAIEWAGFTDQKEVKKKFGEAYKVILDNLVEEFALEHAESVVSVRDPHKPTDRVKELMRRSKEEGRVFEHVRADGSSLYLYKGGALAFYSNKVREIDGEETPTELLTDFWNHISWAGIAGEGGVKLKNGKKPEKLIRQILDIASEPGDIVLDYHLGSGTTAAVAHKMGRRYIGCEQLDYEQNDAVERLRNVIAGDQTGISKSVKWSGGGSFVYCELAEHNEAVISEVQSATSSKQLLSIIDGLVDRGDLRPEVLPDSLADHRDAFLVLDLENQKRAVIEMINKNRLYIAYADRDDETYAVSNDDKAFSENFYGERG